MKTRRKVELAIDDLKRFAAGKDRDPQGFNSYRVIRNLELFREELAGDPQNMLELLKAAQQLAPARGPGTGRAEEHLFELLTYMAEDCCEKLEEREAPIVGRPEEVEQDVRCYWEVLEKLAQFAVWCLGFRKLRDSFGGRRRVAAFALLSHAADFMDLAPAMRLAEQLEKNNRDDGAAASDFLLHYYEKRGMAEKALDSPKILQLKISLRDICPPIWRRILVPNDLLLGDLHYIVNRVMGWDNSHMHAFKVGKIQYAGTKTVEDCGPPIRHEDDVTLAAILKRKGQVIGYKYDFGDSWEHDIKVEDVLPPDQNARLPVCLAGERACPPEDCGGVCGYHRVLEALRNPDHPELREFREWIGQFDPEEFDLNLVNAKLMRMVLTD